VILDAADGACPDAASHAGLRAERPSFRFQGKNRSLATLSRG